MTKNSPPPLARTANATHDQRASMLLRALADVWIAPLSKIKKAGHMATVMSLAERDLAVAISHGYQITPLGADLVNATRTPTCATPPRPISRALYDGRELSTVGYRQGAYTRMSFASRSTT